MLCRWARRVLVVARRARRSALPKFIAGRYAALFSLVRDGGNLLRLRRNKRPAFRRAFNFLRQ
jgi:hypothetical protein